MMKSTYLLINLPFQGASRISSFILPKALPWAMLNKAFSLLFILKAFLTIRTGTLHHPGVLVIKTFFLLPFCSTALNVRSQDRGLLQLHLVIPTGGRDLIRWQQNRILAEMICRPPWVTPELNLLLLRKKKESPDSGKMKNLKILIPAALLIYSLPGCVKDQTQYDADFPISAVSFSPCKTTNLYPDFKNPSIRLTAIPGNKNTCNTE